MEKRIQVLLVDDHPMLRTGLHRGLEMDPEIEVVGEACDFGEGLGQARLLSPDVIVMDVKMPGGTGIQVANQLKRERFPGKVLFLSMHEGYVAEAIGAGACGYLVKTAKIEDIANAIHRAHRGESAFI